MEIVACRGASMVDVDEAESDRGVVEYVDDEGVERGHGV
jgi:hypothetical protein